MTYETVSAISMVSTLFLFITLFVGILVYVLLPSTKRKLDKAQHLALDLDDNQDRPGGQQTP